MRIAATLFSMTILIVSSSLQANIIHVPDDSTTIQGGINGAVDGDTVMIAPGTYYEYNIDFIGKAIVVTGTDPEDSAVVASTVVNADSMGRVFIFKTEEESTSILTGLTITGGYAISSGYLGGGIFCNDASPKILNNIIIGNSASEGGGIHCDCNWTVSCPEPRISNNLITGNFSSAGGAIHCSSFPYSTFYPRITGNIIIRNWTNSIGGGIHIERSCPIISDNVIAENEAPIYGGGISCYYLSYPVLTNNTIVSNTANHGGGIFCYIDVNMTVVNTILWGNSAPVTGPSVRLRDNSTFTISYSDVDGGQYSMWIDSDCTLNWGDGMIDENPIFLGPDSDDYRLQKGSPCIDTGDPSLPNVPWGGWKRDMGAWEYDQGFYYNGSLIIWKPVKYDISHPIKD